MHLSLIVLCHAHELSQPVIWWEAHVLRYYRASLLESFCLYDGYHILQMNLYKWYAFPNQIMYKLYTIHHCCRISKRLTNVFSTLLGTDDWHLRLWSSGHFQLRKRDHGPVSQTVRNVTCAYIPWQRNATVLVPMVVICTYSCIGFVKRLPGLQAEQTRVTRVKGNSQSHGTTVALQLPTCRWPILIIMVEGIQTKPGRNSIPSVSCKTFPHKAKGVASINWI